MIQKLSDPGNAAPLFEGWNETMIWSCLQGVMGSIYANEEGKPESAMAMLGDFCFFAGKPDERLVSYKPVDCRRNFMIMVPRTKEWEPLILTRYQGHVKAVERYAIKKEPEVFGREKLQQAVLSLPEGFVLRPIDEALYHWCQKQSWCSDWVAQYPTWEKYEQFGLGYVVLHGEEVAAGISSYTTYRGGIEIQIDTRPEYRRKGLAYVCGAQMILTCLERGLYPSWDAQNRMSVGLAEKLGYHFSHVYTAYEVYDY